MDDINLTDILAVLRRWKILYFRAFCVFLIPLLIAAHQWSNYRSTAVIQIEQPEISANATKMDPGQQDMNEALADQRVSSIEQKVTSTASLVDIITKYNLFPRERSRRPVSLVADTMRKMIQVELISSTIANPAAAGHISANDLSAIAFKLSFDYRDPLLAQQVTDELASRFLDEDLKERRTETQDTADFLNRQITAVEATLSEQEQKIADYEKIHGMSTSGSLAFNQQAAASLTLSLQNLDSQIMANEGAIGNLRGQIANIEPYSRVIADGQVLTSPAVQLKALQAQYATLSSQYGPDHPDVVKLRNQIQALQAQVGHGSQDTGPIKAQIDHVRTNLAAAQKTYGPQHPDVIALQNQLHNLQSQLATMKPNADEDGLVNYADNPAYLQMAAELKSAEDQRKALIEQRKQMAQQQAGYTKAIAQNPEDEKEMAALSRDYDNAQLRYRELKEKKMTADMAMEMQSDRKGQKFTLIDPPEYPLDTHPARWLLLLGSLLAALLGGLGVVSVAQMLSRSIVGPHHIEMITGATPIVCVPRILTQAERKHWLRRLSSTVGQALVLGNRTAVSRR